MTLNFDQQKNLAAQFDVYVLEFQYEQTTLTAALTDSATAASGLDISDFPNRGYLELPSGEIIEYDLKTYVPASAAAPGWFRITKRGAFNTAAASAASGGILKEPLLDHLFWTTAEHRDIGTGHAIMNVPKGIKQTVKPTEGQSSIGDITFELVDKDNIASKIMALNPMRDRRATLRGGFIDLPYSGFEVEFVGAVREVSMNSEQTVWEVKASDFKRYLKAGIFTQIGKTELDGNVSDSATTFPVNSTDASSTGDTSFVDPTTYPYGVYLKIDDEIIGPITSMTVTSLVGGAGCRGKFGTVAAAHDDNAEVKQCFLLGPANPIDIALQLMLSTGDGTNDPTYDTMPETVSMAIPAEMVDVATFEQQRDEFITSTNFAFFIEDPIDEGKTWIEKSLLKPTNSFMFVTRAGLISFKVSNPPIPGSTPVLVDNQTLVKNVNFSASLSDIVNQIRVEYSKDPASGDYVQTLLVIDADSISRHGYTPWRKLQLEGVHGIHSPLGDQGGDSIAASIGKWYRSRFAEPAPTLGFKANMTRRGISVGDLLRITWDSLPNWLPNRSDSLTGKGVESMIIEVTQLSNNFKDALIEIESVGTQYSWRKFAVIGPNTMADWLTAPETDKYFAYIAATNGAMSDGSDGYLIWFGGGGATDLDIDFLSAIIDTIMQTFKTNDDAVKAKFHISTGHNHDGTAGGGKPVTALGSATFAQDLTVNGWLNGAPTYYDYGSMF